jgi:HMG (high mobility group) box
VIRYTAIALLGTKKLAAVKKKKREPPRKPVPPLPDLTGYTLFVQENFEATRNNNPTMEHKDVVSVIARHWAQTSEEEKQVGSTDAYYT